MRLFFIHPKDRTPTVRLIAKYLPAWLDPWLDEDDLRIGPGLAPALEHVIRSETDYVVALIAEDAANREYIRLEVNCALEREAELGRGFLMPVLYGDVSNQLSVLGLGDRPRLTLFDHSEDAAQLVGRRLTEQVSRLMSERLSVVAAQSDSNGIQDGLHALGGTTRALIDEIPASFRRDVAELLLSPIVPSLELARTGEIALSRTQYYARIVRAMTMAGKDTRVTAVSTLSSGLWTDDKDQTHYASCNFDAVRRETTIQRLFILPKDDMRSYKDAVNRQREAGISVRVGSTSILSRVPELDDFVLFESPSGRSAYIARLTIDRQVRAGSLMLARRGLKRLGDAFHTAWNLSSDADDVFGQ